MRRIGILICFCLAALTARAAHTHVQLLLSANPARPGDTIWAGVDMKMDAGWHTYWKNSGAAGLPTRIEWQLPPGVTAGEIQWPLPEKLPPAEVTTYGYENEVMLLVPLTLATNLNPGPLDLKANVSWLECEQQCVPGSTNVETTLNIGGETKTSADAATIESWKNKVPMPLPVGNSWSVSAWWENLASGDTRSLIIECFPVATLERMIIDKADFFPGASDNFEIQAATENLLGKTSGFRLRKLVKKFSGDWPKEISGVVVMESGGKQTGFEVKLPVSDQAPAVAPATVTSTTPTVSAPVLPAQSLWRMLLYAFIGGLILNLMPCVLPVIALKILGFVSEAGSSPRRIRALGLIYALGVLVSFLVLASVVISIKAAGHHAGWGMQFGSPIFIVCLTTLVTLVALNLFGVFEVTLGGRSRHDFGHTLHRAVSGTGARLCLCPRRGDDYPDFLIRRPRPRVAVYFIELESGVAQISAKTRRVDGKIQDRHGLPDAGNDGVAVQCRFQQLRQKCFVARYFSGRRRLCRVDFWRIFSARSQPQNCGGNRHFVFAGWRLRLCLGKGIGLAHSDASNRHDRFAERIAGRN